MPTIALSSHFVNSLYHSVSSIHKVSLSETHFPTLLKQIPDKPKHLFIRGQLPDDTLPTVAVVGTRRLTRYGKQWTEKISLELAQAGIIIISGLARGIDTIAHKAALEVGTPTVAVLGTGIDEKSIFPKQNVQLARDIIDSGGCILSEYPQGTHGTKYTFPARNRIVAGMSLGTLVTEAPVKSGALITARLALDYNREVMALPHPLGAWTGEGNNNILRKGAHLIRSADDVLKILNIQSSPFATPTRAGSNQAETSILSVLSETLHIDAIIEKTRLSRQEALTTLTLLELKGIIKNNGEMNFTIK